MKESFEDRRLSGKITLNLKEKGIWVADKLMICHQIIKTVERYQEEGYKLTLRQLYYQLVAADIIPNHDTVYKKLSSILDDLRYSGRIDWDAIEDRGRVPYLPYFVHGISDALNDTAEFYRLDRQKGQDVVVEVWTEKDAISGILKKITRRYHVNLVVNKGYSSSSAMYSAYQRFADYINDGKRVKILYFGDHDPSGLDMIRDIKDRIITFLSKGEQLKQNDKMAEWWEDFMNNHFHELSDEFISALEVITSSEKQPQKKKIKSAELYFSEKKRLYIQENDLFDVIPIGLTMTQIEELNPPPNPAKMTDPRAKWYLEEYGDTSWEVDAIEPKLMENIVQTAIEENINIDLYSEMLEKERLEKEEISKIAEDYA